MEFSIKPDESGRYYSDARSGTRARYEIADSACGFQAFVREACGLTPIAGTYATLELAAERCDADYRMTRAASQAEAIEIWRTYQEEVRKTGKVPDEQLAA